MKKFSFNIIESVNKILVLLSLINFVILCFHTISILIISKTTLNFNVDILLYLMILIILLIIFSFIIFKKSLKNIITIILLIGIIFAQIILFFCSFQHPSIKKIFDISFCIDNGKIWDNQNNICKP